MHDAVESANIRCGDNYCIIHFAGDLRHGAGGDDNGSSITGRHVLLEARDASLEAGAQKVRHFGAVGDLLHKQWLGELCRVRDVVQQHGGEQVDILEQLGLADPEFLEEGLEGGVGGREDRDGLGWALTIRAREGFDERRGLERLEEGPETRDARGDARDILGRSEHAIDNLHNTVASLDITSENVRSERVGRCEYAFLNRKADEFRRIEVAARESILVGPEARVELLGDGSQVVEARIAERGHFQGSSCIDHAEARDYLRRHMEEQHGGEQVDILLSEQVCR